MSLQSLLPAVTTHTSRWLSPSDASTKDQSSKDQAKATKDQAQAKAKLPLPPYPRRRHFIPTLRVHYGDGGAYPEIPTVQYPLDMGRAVQGSSSQYETLPLVVGPDGGVGYNLVLGVGGVGKGAASAVDKYSGGVGGRGALKVGEASDTARAFSDETTRTRVVHSSMQDMIAQDIVDGDNQRPADVDVEKVTEKTREALDKLVNGRINAGRTKHIKSLEEKKQSYVRYQPTESAAGGAETRIVKLVEAPIDPMEPSRFKHRKVPRGPPSPPPPVLQSPPRKVTAEQQKNWVIPPCISNWKNAKGYTIPLDKRLANDGRGLQDVSINDNFAKLSEALFIADRHAREEVKLRSDMQVKLAQKEKKAKEDKLRALAQQARDERSGLRAPVEQQRESSESESESGSDTSQKDSHLSREELEKLRERQDLRREKQRQRQREVRNPQKRYSFPNQSTGDRDVSEKIALGLAQPTLSKESMYDSRLFNQSSGIASGFTQNDSYNLYDKPLFTGSAANSIYKPNISQHAQVDERLEQLVGAKAKGKGVELARDGPVQFEKEDLFGMDAFMSAAKRGGESTSESTKRHKGQ